MSSTFSVEEALIVALSAAEAAGNAIVDFRRTGTVEVSFKSAKDLVTNADLRAEAIIIDHIRDKFPEHSLLTEEGFPTIRDPRDFLKPLWIIDPIDGTANYAHGLAQVAVSIAFAEHGLLKAAVVHAPFQGETFHAIRGQGAKLNGTAIRTSEVTQLSHAIVATGFPGWRTSANETVAQLRAVLDNCRDIRRFGSAALDVCWVAAGRIDGYWESVNPWDIAAGALIAKEAGALTGHVIPPPTHSTVPTEFDGTHFFTAAPGIFHELQNLLRNNRG